MKRSQSPFHRHFRRSPGFIVLVAALIAASTALAVEDAVTAEPAEVLRVASAIDRLVEQKWVAEGAVPSEPADDAEYLRRVSLHVGGCIPSATAVRQFLADTAADKRRRIVNEMLDGPAYIIQFTRYWRRTLLPEAEVDAQARFLLPGFEAWLREQLIDDVPYDKFVEQILQADLQLRDPQENYRRLQSASPLAFYHARDAAPENLAAATSRAFLGVRIECAQCHHHPFDRWRRENFWSYAAFFAGVVRDGQSLGRIREIPDRREIAVDDTRQIVQAAFLDGTAPRWRFRAGARETLSGWVTSAENPFFAKAAVNRLWGHFYGRGIVEPVDDFSDNNPPSHPELLDLLAKEFVACGFDVKFMIRAITATRTYQLSSRQTHPSQEDAALFARMQLQRLTAEELFDSLAQATGTFQPFSANRAASFGGSSQSEFFELFDDTAAPVAQRETTILQALAMMNGQPIAEATSAERSRTLGAIATAPFLKTQQRVEALYLAALSRRPGPDEAEMMSQYVESGGPANDPARALADVFWALLNSTEFHVNH